MKVIDNWLNGRQNFNVGVAIYKTLGKDKNLLSLLLKGHSTFAAKQLKDALTDIAKQPVKAAEIIVVNEETGKMPEADEPVLNAIREEWLIPYKKMVYLRHSLDQYEGNAPEMIKVRKPIALEILELEQQCIRLWKKRDGYIKDGTLPEHNDKKVEIPTDPVELGKFIENSKRNIRRNKQQMALHPDKPLFAQLYKEYVDKYKLATGKDYKEAK